MFGQRSLFLTLFLVATAVPALAERGYDGMWVTA